MCCTSLRLRQLREPWRDPKAHLPMSISLSPCKICSLHGDLLAQNLTFSVRCIGPRHKGHRGGALDMMSSAHDSQAHCMRHQKSAQSAVQHNVY